MKHQIAVVGGGISGLACAKQLSQNTDMEVTLLESSTRCGGVLQTHQSDGFLCETASNGFLNNCIHGAAELCKELGVPTETAATQAKHRWIFHNEVLHRLPSNLMEIWDTTAVSWRAKLAALLEPIRKAAPSSQETIHQFACRRLGKEIAETIIAPYVTGVFGGESDMLSARAAFPELVALEESGGILIGLLKKQWKQRKKYPERVRTRLCSPVGGMQALVDALYAHANKTYTLRLQTPVTSMQLDANKIKIEHRGGNTSFDAALLTTPAYFSSGIVEKLSHELAGVLDSIPYAPMVVVCLGFPRKNVEHFLDGFGFLVTRGERVRMLGTVFESTLWSHRAPPGEVLVRCMYGGTRDPSILDHSDKEILHIATQELKQVLGPVGIPSFARITRWKRAIAQYTPGHMERVSRAKELALSKRILLAGSSYQGVSVNACIAESATISKQMRQLLVS